jgi:hypothetical protein
MLAMQLTAWPGQNDPDAFHPFAGRIQSGTQSQAMATDCDSRNSVAYFILQLSSS